MLTELDQRSSRIIPVGGEQTVDQTERVPVVQLKNASYAYPPATPELPSIPALVNVSLTITGGQVVGLVGQNGSGKTTLARHLNGLLRPDSGVIRVLGEDAAGRSVGELSRIVGYVFQNPDHALFLPSVREEILYGLSRLDLTGDQRQERMQLALERFGISELIDVHPASLARGLRRLVVAAAIEAMQPQVLVLDEPTGGLDHGLTQRLAGLASDIAAEGRTVIVITHDMRLVAEHCDHAVLMHEGRLLGEGAPRSLFHDHDLLESSGIRAPQAARLAEDVLDCGATSEIVTVADLARTIGPKVRR